MVVGAGSADCVLAARLAQNTAAQVLLIEAGDSASSPAIAVPMGFATLMGQEPHNGVTAPPKSRACCNAGWPCRAAV